MRKKLSYLILLLITFSCEKNPLMTKNEAEAVQKVADFFGGYCELSKGFESENTNIKTYSELEVSESVLLKDSPKKKYTSHSGNIAYLFYSNLGNEKDNHEEIRVRIISENGENSDYQYLKTELKEIDKLISKINNTTEIIKKSEFEKVKNLFDKTVQVETTQIKDLFKNIESKFGKTTDYQFQGFEFLESNNYGDIVKLSLVQIMEKANLYITLNYKRSSKDLLSIEFE